MSTTSNVGEAGEEPDDSSSLLKEFREKWQKELHGEADGSRTNDLIKKEKKSEPDIFQDYVEKLDLSKEENDEQRATLLFLQGTEYERLGKVFDAMRCYRKAVQLVPDIEFKMYENTKSSLQQNVPLQIDNPNDDKFKSNITNVINWEIEEDLENVDLMVRFQSYLFKAGKLCERINSEKNIIYTGSHLSDLPTEIILYILKWVVSDHLDMRSLEQCAAVSKGFYVCARDPEIWRMACIKIWGVNTGTLKGSLYESWRQMYQERPRINFNGCYISKTSYLRYGENSFQDQFYRPVQLIEYYRYMRFFPDGHILMMTSADEPSLCVTKLKFINPTKKEILVGHYRLHGDMIVIVLKRTRQHQPFSYLSRRRTFAKDSDVQTFYIEMNIVSSKKRKFCQLQWKHYSILQVKNKTDITSNFELTPNQYPPLWFSQVRSYHAETESPLQ